MELAGGSAVWTTFVQIAILRPFDGPLCTGRENFRRAWKGQIVFSCYRKVGGFDCGKLRIDPSILGQVTFCRLVKEGEILSSNEIRGKRGTSASEMTVVYR